MLSNLRLEKKYYYDIRYMRKEESKEHEMNESTTSLRYSIARRKKDFFRNSDVLVDILKTGFLYLDMLLRRSML